MSGRRVRQSCRERQRKRDDQSQSDGTMRLMDEKTVDIIVPERSACWQSHYKCAWEVMEGRGMVGPINAVLESRAAPISDPKISLLPNIF